LLSAISPSYLIRDVARDWRKKAALAARCLAADARAPVLLITPARHHASLKSVFMDAAVGGAVRCRLAARRPARST
jgi:hypothetical protein